MGSYLQITDALQTFVIWSFCSTRELGHCKSLGCFDQFSPHFFKQRNYSCRAKYKEKGLRAVHHVGLPGKGMKILNPCVSKAIMLQIHVF